MSLGKPICKVYGNPGIHVLTCYMTTVFLSFLAPGRVSATREIPRGADPGPVLLRGDG